SRSREAPGGALRGMTPRGEGGRITAPRDAGPGPRRLSRAALRHPLGRSGDRRPPWRGALGSRSWPMPRAADRPPTGVPRLARSTVEAIDLAQQVVDARDLVPAPWTGD